MVREGGLPKTIYRYIYGYKPVKEFEEIINRDMEWIRECYDRLSWNSNEDFVKLIIHDSVFILLFFMITGSIQNFTKKEEIVSGLPSVLQIKATTIKEDLILLENQLPYALLEKLFQPFFSTLNAKETFRGITLRTFGLEKKIKEDVRFLHFTDLFRRVRVSTLHLTEENENRRADETGVSTLHLTEENENRRAEKLYEAGVSFVTVDKGNPSSLVITFEAGILKLPCLIVDGSTERYLANLMALEQSHYPRKTYVCDYVSFLNVLIITGQDVEILATNGIVRNWLGEHELVTQMVKKLCSGLTDSQSKYYDDVAESLKKYYDNRLKRSVVSLQRVYFKDNWTSTATVTAIVLVVLTVFQTVASVLQLQYDKKSLPPPAPSRGP